MRGKKKKTNSVVRTVPRFYSDNFLIDFGIDFSSEGNSISSDAVRVFSRLKIKIAINTVIYTRLNQSAGGETSREDMNTIGKEKHLWLNVYNSRDEEIIVSLCKVSPPLTCGREGETEDAKGDTIVAREREARQRRSTTGS